MPSGALLPHQTFSEFGMQAVRSAAADIENENVISDFLSLPPRNYINGRSTAVIDGSTVQDDAATAYPSADSTAAYLPTVRFQDFDIPNDSDAVGAIYFSYEFDYDSPAMGIVENTTTSRPANKLLPKTLGYSIIDRVEIRVGQQVWQELSGADIFARNLTEKEAGDNDLNGVLDNVRIDQIYHRYGAGYHSERVDQRADGTPSDNTVPPADSSGTAEKDLYHQELPLGVLGHNIAMVDDKKIKVSGIVDLMSFCGSGDKSNMFLQAGAPNQSIKVRVFYNKFKTSKLDTNNIVSGDKLAFDKYTRLVGDMSNITNFKTSIIAEKYIFTKSERDYIADNIINNVIKTSQSVKLSNVSNAAVDLSQNGSSAKTFHSGKTFTVNVNLSEIKINVSHLIITMFKPALKGASDPIIGIESGETFAGAHYVPINYRPTGVELGISATAKGANYGDNSDAHKLKHFRGMVSGLVNANLKVNGISHSDLLPAHYLLKESKRRIGLYHNTNGNEFSAFPIYVIPIASGVFGTDSVPFNKLSSKTLELTFDAMACYNQGAFSSHASHVDASKVDINITAVGTNIASYVGGTTALQMSS